MARMLAHGAVLYLGDGATPVETFDPVPWLGTIAFIFPDAELADITSHDDEFHEELPGMQEIVEIDVPITWDLAQATHTTIQALAITHDPSNWKVVTASGSTIAFPARVRSRELALGIVNQAEQFKFKLRVMGAVVVT